MASGPRPHGSDRFLIAVWCLVVFVAFVGTLARASAVVGAAGLLVVGFGLLLVLNVGGFATREIARRVGHRYMGIGPLRPESTRLLIRLTGAGAVVVGAIWAILGFS